jgi:hypothetical protein
MLLNFVSISTWDFAPVAEKPVIRSCAKVLSGAQVIASIAITQAIS